MCPLQEAYPHRFDFFVWRVSLIYMLCMLFFWLAAFSAIASVFLAALYFMAPAAGIALIAVTSICVATLFLVWIVQLGVASRMEKVIEDLHISSPV